MIKMKKLFILMIVLSLFACSVYSIPYINRVSQHPNDITNNNIFAKLMNITYNISASMGESIINSSILFYHMTNNTYTNCSYYINGIKYCGWQTNRYSNGTDIKYEFKVDDNEILPASYNIKEEYMETTLHSINTQSVTNNLIKIRLYNISSLTRYNFLEIYANVTTGVAPLRVYYCNSSYVNGNVGATPNCVLFYNLATTTPFNHTHTIFSSHKVIPLGISATGHVAGVKVTKLSYFLFRGTTGTAWQIYYIANNTGTIQTSANQGVAYANLVGTVDAHVHQFYGNDSFTYFVCATDTNASSGCSSKSYDLLELGGLPPTAPDVKSPITHTYNQTFFLNYTESISPNGYAVNDYNVSIYNASGYVKTLTPNLYPFFTYTYNTSTIVNGNYYIAVKACDSIGQCSFGYSDNFTIYNAPREIVWDPASTVVSIAGNHTLRDVCRAMANMSPIWKCYGKIHQSGFHTRINASARLTIGPGEILYNGYNMRVFGELRIDRGILYMNNSEFVANTVDGGAGIINITGTQHFNRIPRLTDTFDAGIRAYPLDLPNDYYTHYYMYWGTRLYIRDAKMTGMIWELDELGPKDIRRTFIGGYSLFAFITLLIRQGDYLEDVYFNSSTNIGGVDNIPRVYFQNSFAPGIINMRRVFINQSKAQPQRTIMSEAGIYLNYYDGGMSDCNFYNSFSALTTKMNFINTSFIGNRTLDNCTIDMIPGSIYDVSNSIEFTYPLSIKAIDKLFSYPVENISIDIYYQKYDYAWNPIGGWVYDGHYTTLNNGNLNVTKNLTAFRYTFTNESYRYIWNITASYDNKSYYNLSLNWSTYRYAPRFLFIIPIAYLSIYEPNKQGMLFTMIAVGIAFLFVALAIIAGLVFMGADIDIMGIVMAVLVMAMGLAIIFVFISLIQPFLLK